MGFGGNGFKFQLCCENCHKVSRTHFCGNPNWAERAELKFRRKKHRKEWCTKDFSPKRNTPNVQEMLKNPRKGLRKGTKGIPSELTQRNP
eukprot:1061881-Amphidinium_carterae.1